MPRPKTDRAAVALRPPTDLLEEIDAEALRTGQSRHGEILALIADGLAARQAPTQTVAASPAASAKKPGAAPTKSGGKMTMDDVRPAFKSRLKNR